jgi:hypothetical protein
MKINVFSIISCTKKDVKEERTGGNRNTLNIVSVSKEKIHPVQTMRVTYAQ